MSKHRRLFFVTHLLKGNQTLRIQVLQEYIEDKSIPFQFDIAELFNVSMEDLQSTFIELVFGFAENSWGKLAILCPQNQVWGAYAPHAQGSRFCHAHMHCMSEIFENRRRFFPKTHGFFWKLDIPMDFLQNIELFLLIGLVSIPSLKNISNLTHVL